MSLLPFKEDIIEVKDGTPEARELADRHYSRKKPGANLFVGPGIKKILMNPGATWLFVWRYCRYRLDGQTGWECCLFRNESRIINSEIILMCESFVSGRKFTYVDPRRVRSTNPGYCFQQAGWEKAGVSKERRLILLVKD